jgi:cell division protein FtsZ
MAGKDRSSKASSSAKSVAFQQRPRSEKLASEQGHRDGSSLSAGRRQSEGEGSDASMTRQNSEEAIEIPKFFKKPIS